VLLVWLVSRRLSRVQPIAGLTWFLGALIGLQIALGAGTWVVKFAVPAWAAGWIGTPSIQEGSWLQTHVITAHVATGSLILGIAVALALYSQRLLADAPSTRPIVRRELGAAV
jgi:hypothetical protein